MGLIAVLEIMQKWKTEKRFFDCPRNQITTPIPVLSTEPNNHTDSLIVRGAY